MAQMESFSRLKVNSGKTAVYHRDKAGEANDTAMILGPCIRMELKCRAMCSAAPSLWKKILSDSKSATVQLYLEENNHVQRKTINTVVACQGEGENLNKFLSSYVASSSSETKHYALLIYFSFSTEQTQSQKSQSNIDLQCFADIGLKGHEL